MAVIRVHDGTAYTSVEVTDELAAGYAEMERLERLTERKEIARRVGVSKLAINKRLSRILARLKKNLQ